MTSAATAPKTHTSFHMLLVHLPIVLWLGSVAADVVAALSGASHALGYYLAIVGCVGAGLAAITGMIDMAGALATMPEQVRKTATSHVAATLVAILFFWADVSLRSAPEVISGGVWLAAFWGLVMMALAGQLGRRLGVEMRAAATASSAARYDATASASDAGEDAAEPSVRV